MKKILLSFVFLMGTIFLMAQTAPREMVVVEDGTGLWCTYCPGAAMGCDDLLANGKFVAVIGNHNGDTLANTYSNARNTFYGISAFPSVGFDGVRGYVGGNHSTSLYNTYLPKYTACIADPSPVSLSMVVTNTGLAYTAVITITKVGTIASTNLALHFVVTQSKLQINWQGQNHCEHATRLMVPNQNGTAVDFTSGDVQTVTLNFDMSTKWKIENCEFIAFLQDMTAGQGNQQGTTSPYIIKKYAILNAIKRGTIDLTPDFTVSATNVDKGVPVTYTNATTGGYIGVPETYNWIFQGGTPSTSTDKNPVVTYDNCGTFDATLIVNRGGQIDSLTRSAYIQVGPLVNVTANPGLTACWYQTITLDATTAGATAYLWMPGGETTPTIDVTYAQYGLGAHDFNVTVSAGGCDIVSTVSTYLDACTGVAEKTKDVTISVFPNPSNGNITLELNSVKNMVADLIITNNLGMQVYAEKNIPINGKTIKNLNLAVSSGLYMLSIQNSELKVNHKILIK